MPALDDTTLTALAIIAICFGVFALVYGVGCALLERKRKRAPVSLRTVSVTLDDDRTLCRHCHAYQRFDSQDVTCWLCHRPLDAAVDAVATPDTRREAN